MNREVDRTALQVCFAEGTEIINLPLGLRYIVAREANVLKREVEACELTDAEWFNSQFVRKTLTEITRELSVSLSASACSFGLGRM